MAGTAGGLRLRAPKGSRTRPTTERVREAAFASLDSMGVIDGCRVLDLFAGTGAMGIEALSRGAAAATFVDQDPSAVAAIRANLAATGFESCGEVVRADALRFCESVSAQGREWDLAVLDPPYGFEGWPALLDRLPASLAVIESGEPLGVPRGWMVIKARRYGGTVVTTVRRQRPSVT